VADKAREGLLYGIAAYVLWGVVPFYFAPLMRMNIRPEEVLAHRVVWSLAFLLPIVSFAGRWRDVHACFQKPSIVGLLFVSALLIAANWLVYILCVANGRITHASLGYYLTPLVSVLLGRLVFRERLRLWQSVAVALATGGVVYLVVAGKEFPWLGLTLAFSFGFYGLVRKQVPVDGLVGLSMETLLLAPITFAFIITWAFQGTLAFATQSRSLDLLIALGGVVTAAPLLCFGQAARRLSLTTLGFLQFLSPSLQLVFAVTLFGEPFTRERGISFLLIWSAVALFAFDSWRGHRQTHAELEPVTET
jgi:chloramphenicol-sensitive protein RarD